MEGGNEATSGSGITQFAVRRTERWRAGLRKPPEKTHAETRRRGESTRSFKDFFVFFVFYVFFVVKFSLADLRPRSSMVFDCEIRFQRDG